MIGVLVGLHETMRGIHAHGERPHEYRAVLLREE